MPILHQKDDSTFEISRAVLKLNDGLQFTLQASGQDTWCLIEDDARGKVYRVGLPEYTVLSLLDGRRTLGEAVAKAAFRLGSRSMDENSMAQLAQWIIQSGLAHSDASQSQFRLTDIRQKETASQWVQQLNPISIKIPLFNPDLWVGRVERSTRAISGALGKVVWWVVVACGFFLLLRHGKELFLNRLPSYSAFDWVYFFLAWFVLKLIHELAHAVTCKRFGGTVSQFGMLLLLFIPLPFVDVTSSWRFENKYHRILTSFAGMLSELFLASLALVFWCNLDDGTLRHHLGDLIIAATLHTVLFNANPLMKFDGYYMLSDWLEIPNLATRGRNHVKQVGHWIFFGGALPTNKTGDGWIVKTYGWAATVWMVLVCLSISTVAISLFGGAGMILVAIASVFWVGVPAFRWIKFLCVGSETQTPNRLRFFGVALLIILMCMPVCWLPAPAAVSFPVIVDFQDQTVVRAQANGFVKTIFVHPQERVKRGQPLIQLSNVDLMSDFEAMKIELETERLRGQILEAEGEIAALQQQRELIQAVEKRYQELSQLVEKLTIRSPIDGSVSTPLLSDKLGTHIQQGEEIVRIGSGDDLILVGLVDQQQAKWLRMNQQDAVHTHIWGDVAVPFPCRLTQLPHRATQAIDRPAFAANNGGPIPVTAITDAEKRFESDQLARSEETLDGLKFLRAKVEVSLEFSHAPPERCHPGQMGLAKVFGRNQSLSEFLWNKLTRAVQRNSLNFEGI